MECLLLLMLVVVAFLVMIFGLGRTRDLLGAALTGCMVKLGGAALVLLVLLCGLQSLLTRVSSSLGGGDAAPPPVSQEQGGDAEPPDVGGSSRVSPSGLVYPLDGLTDRESYRRRLMAGYLAGSDQPGRGSYVSDDKGRPLVHLADDLRAQEGDTVYAMADGKVMVARMDASGFGPDWGPGGVVIVEHSTPSGPLWVVYGHVKDLEVARGGQADRGDPIAKVGPWHNATHLHLALRDTPPPSRGWGTGLKSAVVTGTGIDTLGWQDPCEVLHTAP